MPLLSFITTEQPFGPMLEFIIAGMTSERDVPAGCLFTRMRLETHRLGPKTAARIVTFEEERLRAFEERYGRALEAGEAEPSLSPAFAARYLDTQLSTVLLQMGATAPPDQIRAEAKLALSVLVRLTDCPPGCTDGEEVSGGLRTQGGRPHDSVLVTVDRLSRGCRGDLARSLLGFCNAGLLSNSGCVSGRRASRP